MPEALTTTTGVSLSPKAFQQFADFITRELGIKMPDGKASMLEGRLSRRLHVLGLKSLDEYQEYLFHSPKAEEERIQFINAITTNKTDFFREPQHFEYLTRTVLPQLEKPLPRGASWRFKLWCAGCSSGEEPYTQAMVLSEYARQSALRAMDFALLATDISTRVLDHARQAIYEEERIGPIPVDLRKRYLLRSKDPNRPKFRIVPDLRSRITFHRLNFMDSNYGVRDEFDVISFRNVMIYFDKPTQESVINKLCRNLKPGGYLFVGHSESLAGLNIPVEAVGPAIFRKGS